MTGQAGYKVTTAGGGFNLPPRLEAIASRIPPGSAVADIGADHGYLAIHLAGAGRCGRVIATEVKDGPLDILTEHIRAARAGLSVEIEARLGSGLEPLDPGEVDVAVLAGMGGNLLCQLLSTASEKRVGRFILQPPSHARELRRWLWREGWRFVDEELIWEGSRAYPIIETAPPERQVTDCGESVTGLDTRAVAGANAVDIEALAAEMNIALETVLEVGPILLRRYLEHEHDDDADGSSRSSGGGGQASKGAEIAAIKELLKERLAYYEGLATKLRAVIDADVVGSDVLEPLKQAQDRAGDLRAILDKGASHK